jgi:hypothetical protein
MPLFHFAFLLLRQTPKYRTQFPPQLPPIFGVNAKYYLHSRVVGFKLSYVCIVCFFRKL